MVLLGYMFYESETGEKVEMMASLDAPSFERSIGHIEIIRAKYIQPIVFAKHRLCDQLEKRDREKINWYFHSFILFFHSFLQVTENNFFPFVSVCVSVCVSLLHRAVDRTNPNEKVESLHEFAEGYWITSLSFSLSFSKKWQVSSSHLRNMM
jgi:hypothetical protein